MRAIIGFFVRNWRFSVIITILLIFSGISSLLSLTRESFPPVDFAKVIISSIYPGSSPEEVEQKITISIENELRGIEGIKDVKSTSQNERSRIEIRIEMDNPDIQVREVVTQIQRAVDRVQNLPPDMLERPRITEANAKEIPVLEFAIIGPNFNRQRDVLAQQIKSVLEDIEGVSEVRLVGYTKPEYQVLLNPEKLSRFDIGIPEIRGAVLAKINDTPVGYIRGSEKKQMVRIKAKLKTIEELNELPIRTGDSGRTIFLKDVGRAVLAQEEPSILASLNGEDATLLVVTKKPSADAVALANKAKDLVQEISHTLPENIKIEIYNNESKRIERRIKIVTSNAIQGFVLVLLITFIFLPLRLGIMISLSLPISLLGTFYYMHLFGGNFNLITMLGLIIALGMLVDNAVVVGELYNQELNFNRSAQEAAINAAHRFWLALLCSILTTVAAFAPMLVTKGVMGQFIKWIPLVVNAALLFSLFDSFFLLPARIQFMGQTQQRSLSSWRDAWFTPLQKLFEGSLLWLMKHPWVTVGLFIVTFIGSFALTFLGNRFELFPKEGVEFYLGRIDLPLQSPLLKTQHEIKRISKEIIQLLGNDNIEAVIGRAGIQLAGIGDPLEKTEEHTGMIMVKIKADKAYSLNVQEVINTLNSKINKGAVEKMFFEAIGNGPPVGKPLNLVLKSSREDHLVTAIEEITMHLSKLVGIRNLATDQVSTGNEILIYPKMQNLNFVKLTEADLSSSLRAAYQGIVVTKFYENGEDFILRIRYDEPFRKSLKSFDFIKILNQRNQLIDLKYLVQTQERPASPVLRRYNFERSITLTAETDPTKLSAVTLNQKAAEYVESLKKRYPTLSAQFGGEAESTKESVESLVRALILALFGILAILVFAFNSFIKPLLVISSIPLGLVGVNLAFFLHQKPLSFLALIGVIGLAGVIVNSAIILVSAIDEKLSNNSVTQLPLDQRVKIVVDVSTERLKPILITSLTTVAGLFPTAYGMGGYDATLVPLTLAMGWGLFVGTFLSLVWIPTLYRVLFLRRPHRITK